MSGDTSMRPSGFSFAWWVVLFAMVASGALAGLLFEAAYSIAHHAAGMFAVGPNLQDIPRAAIASSLFAVPVGAVSATICAPFLMRKPRRRVFRNIWRVSLIVGVLVSPLSIYSLAPVLIAQVLLSAIMWLDDEREDSVACTNCDYSFAGLDRARTGVCPECGAALLVKNQAE